METDPETPREGHDVFVSYAREDQLFVRRLTEALAERGKRSWVDWADIPPTAEWMAEIRGAIDASDTYVVVLSPDSVRSKICAAELDQALQASKRIVPVLAREVDESEIPPEVAKLNWVAFTEGFEPALDRLTHALDTDLEHVRAHTRLLVRARDWDGKGEDKALLVRGRELEETEGWLAAAGTKEPPPTTLHTRFLLASRRAATRRQRGLISGVAVALVVALVLGGLALVQRNSAVENQRLAERRALESRSRELAAAAVGQLETDPELSLLLSQEAMTSSRTPEALESLRLSVGESRVRRRLTGHEDDVVMVSFSSDGARLLSASFDGTARIWNIASESEPIVLAGHADLLEIAAFSPDGGLVVTAGFDGLAKVWDAATGSELASLQGHVGAVHDAEFSPDGALVLTAGADGTARIWDARTGKQIHSLRGHSRPVYDADFSPDGRLLVTASDDDTARLWDARSGRELLVLDGHTDGLYTAAFEPAGRKVVTASEDGTAKVWDTRTGRLISKLEGSRGPVLSASYSPDGQMIVTASQDGTARIWTSSGRQLAILRGHQDEVNTASFSTDGRLVVTGSRDGTARVWDATEGTSLAILRGHVGSLPAATFAPDGEHVATGGSDGTVRLWDPLQERAVYAGEASWSSWDSGAERVSIASFDGTVRVIDARTGLEQWVAEPGVPQTSANFSKDGSLVVSGGLDGIGRVWDSRTGELVSELEGHEPTYLAAEFYGTNKVLTWSDDGTARLWDPRSGKELMVFDHGASIWEAHMGADGTRVFTTGTPTDGAIRMWDAATGEQMWEADGLLTTSGIGAGFSPDGALVGTVANQDVLWDVETGRRVAVMQHPAKAASVGFSPDSRKVLSRFEDGTARVWDPRTGKILTTMTGPPGIVNSAVFSLDGRWITTTSDDGLIRVWDAASGAMVTKYEGAGGAAAFAFFVLDDRAVVSDSQGGVMIHRCDVCEPTRGLMKLSRERTTRVLTRVEREKYLGASGDSELAFVRRDGLANIDGEPVPDGPLSPGRYHIVGFDPAVSFAVEEGWIASTFLDKARPPEVSLGTLVQLQRVDRPSDGMGFIMLDPGRVIDGFKEWDEHENILTFPENFPAWLATHPNLKTLHRRSVTVGGVEGMSVDSVVTSVPDRNPWPTCGGCVTVLAMSLTDQTGPITTENLINVLSLGEHDRWIVLESPEHTLLVNAFSASKEDFREFLQVVGTLLRSVRIGSADG